jgi:1-phosphofructokinase
MKRVLTVTLNPAIDKTIEIDRFYVGELNRVNKMRLDPGGKGINVAKVLHEFGVNVEASGLIAGYQGDYLAEAVKQMGIATNFLKIPGETRTNLKIFDTTSTITTEINEIGFFVDEKHIADYKKMLTEQLKDAEILVLSGSIPEGISTSIYKELIEIANQMGVKTILDADGQPLIEGIAAKPFAIKPNIHELERVFGRALADTQQITDAVSALIDGGIGIVIVSMGAKGAIVMDKNERLIVEPYPVERKSTVGAGDSMVGALAYSLINKLTLKEIAAWTTAAAAITVSKIGTQVCTFNEVLEIKDKVQIK